MGFSLDNCRRASSILRCRSWRSSKRRTAGARAVLRSHSTNPTRANIPVKVNPKPHSMNCRSSSIRWAKSLIRCSSRVCPSSSRITLSSRRVSLSTISLLVIVTSRSWAACVLPIAIRAPAASAKIEAFHRIDEDYYKPAPKKRGSRMAPPFSFLPHLFPLPQGEG